MASATGIIVGQILGSGQRDEGIKAAHTLFRLTILAGIFRAGGDSKFGFICDTIDMWCYAVPLGLLAAFVFKQPVKVVFFLLFT